MTADLPEHEHCDPDAEHCLGCCPGGCEKPMHQPPRDGPVWHPIGIWNAPSGWPGPLNAPKRIVPPDPTRPYHGPSIGGPSR